MHLEAPNNYELFFLLTLNNNRKEGRCLLTNLVGLESAQRQESGAQSAGLGGACATSRPGRGLRHLPASPSHRPAYFYTFAPLPGRRPLTLSVFRNSLDRNAQSLKGFPTSPSF